MILALLLAGCAQPRQAEIAPVETASAAVSQPPLAARWRSLDALIPDAEEEAEEPAADPWQRLRDGLALPEAEHPSIERLVAEFARRPRQVERMALSASPLLGYVLDETEARGLPAELALVPMIESGYQPEATSPRNAGGLWQLMPGTAANLGVHRTQWYDGRYDVRASTEAALDYLTSLYRTFDGDWLLALAAYNSGEGTVLRAIKANRRAGKPTTYWDLDLPAETLRYIPKILALRDVLSDPEGHGVTLPEETPQAMATVDLGPRMDLSIAAAMAGVTRNELLALNPAIRPEAEALQVPVTLLLPSDNAQALSARLDALSDAVPARWLSHRLLDGETLGDVARAYGSSVGAIREVNALSETAPSPGTELLVPSLSQDATASARTHSVTAGETLSAIARRYGSSRKALADANGLSSDARLRVGQALRIPGADETGPRIAVGYAVRDTESMEALSARLSVDAEQLRLWNDLPADAEPRPGQRLLVLLPATPDNEG